MPRTPADFVENAARQALAGTGPYLHESAGQATLDVNAAAVPVIVLADYTLNQQTTTDRVVRASLTLYLATSKEGQGDDPDAEHAALLEMGQLRQRFLAALDSNPLVEITGIRVTPMHGLYEAMLTGMGLQFTLGVPASALQQVCLPEPLPAAVVPGYNDQLLLLALAANGTATLDKETNHSYGNDYR